MSQTFSTSSGRNVPVVGNSVGNTFPRLMHQYQQYTPTPTLDKRRKKPNLDGTWPVKFIIDLGGQVDYVALPDRLSASDTDFAVALRPKGGSAIQQRLRATILHEQQRAATIVRDLHTNGWGVTLTHFKAAWRGELKPGVAPVGDDGLGEVAYEVYRAPIEDNLVQALLAMYDYLKAPGKNQSRTAGLYRDTARSVQKLMGISQKNHLRFAGVTLGWLREYETAMLQRGGKKGQGQKRSSVGIYMRCIRAAFNAAIVRGYVKQSAYPFGRGKYVAGKATGNRGSLTTEQMRQIEAYEFPPIIRTNGRPDRRAMYRDLFLFLYHAQGMNCKDMVMLHGRNLNQTDDLISFKREKIRHTAPTAPETVVPITTRLRMIINRWGRPNAKPHETLFPLTKQPISTDEYAVREARRVGKRINESMREVFAALGITNSAHTYLARNCFVNNSLENGVDINQISKAISHTSLSQTGVYADELKADRMRLANELL